MSILKAINDVIITKSDIIRTFKLLHYWLHHSENTDTDTRIMASILITNDIIGALLTINYAFADNICGIALLVIINPRQCRQSGGFVNWNIWHLIKNHRSHPLILGSFVVRVLICIKLNYSHAHVWYIYFS